MKTCKRASNALVLGKTLGATKITFNGKWHLRCPKCKEFVAEGKGHWDNDGYYHPQCCPLCIHLKKNPPLTLVGKIEM